MPTSPQAPARPEKGAAASFTAALGAATGPQTAELPYLGDYPVVDSLLRALLAEELGRASDKGTGELSDADYGQQSLAAVKRMARIFTGADAGRYSPMAGWNTAPKLPGGRTLTVAIQERLAGQVNPATMASPWDAATALFSLALLEWREGIGAYAQNLDADQLQQLGEELVENYTRLLVGLPAEDDPDL